MATWHVLGIGAIGALYADFLARAGESVALIGRAPVAVSTYTIRRIALDGSTASCQLPYEDSTNSQPISRLLVCTKAYDILPAIASVSHRLIDTAEVLLLSNGMGYQEALSEKYPPYRFTSAVITNGAYHNPAGELVHAGRGKTILGKQGQTKAPPWFEQWQLAVPLSQWSDQIYSMQRGKLGINCAINPLTAVHRCLNGELVENPEYYSQLKALCQEIGSVFNALGEQKLAKELLESVEQVIRATAKNQSSMLQDALANRPTEIDFLNGHLKQQADHFGINMPNNTRLIARIKRQ